ncbi:MAG: hypothetical protein AAFX53_17795 [Bacteroidota bacterium]
MLKKINIWRILAFALLFWIGYQFMAAFLTTGTRADIATSKTDIRISSEKLVWSFLADENKAQAVFVEKTVEVEGTVKKINTKNDRYTLFLQGSEENTYVMCDMLPNQMKTLRELQRGQTVRLKGICKGFLMDAIFLNCIVLED